MYLHEDELLVSAMTEKAKTAAAALVRRNREGIFYTRKGEIRTLHSGWSLIMEAFRGQLYILGEATALLLDLTWQAGVRKMCNAGK